jgi:hypothetical protein
MVAYFYITKCGTMCTKCTCCTFPAYGACVGTTNVHPTCTQRAPTCTTDALGALGALISPVVFKNEGMPTPPPDLSISPKQIQEGWQLVRFRQIHPERFRRGHEQSQWFWGARLQHLASCLTGAQVCGILWPRPDTFQTFPERRLDHVPTQVHD